MPLGTAEKFALYALLIGLLLFGVWYYVVIYPQQIGPAPEPIKYKEDIVMTFKVRDDTAGSLLTSDLSVDIFETGVNPMGYTFVGYPLTSATYDTTRAAWYALIDITEPDGIQDFLILVADAKASKTLYPVLERVTVKGFTESEYKDAMYHWGELRRDVGTIHMVERASISVSTAIKAYDESTGSYVSVSNINITAYSKWWVVFEFNVAGLKKVIKAGRFYLPNYDGLTYSLAYVDGKQAPIYYDDNSADDGMTGYYIQFPDWDGGKFHRIEVIIEKTGTPSTGTITATLFEYYACLRIDLRHWEDLQASLEVVA